MSMSITRSFLDLDIPENVKAALASLTSDEQRKITAAISYETGEYIGVGFFENGQFTRPANPEKRAAFDVIDAQLRAEFSRMRTT